MLKKKFNSYVMPLQSQSSSMLPILFSPPGACPSLHVAIYLPTAGRDTEFAIELANLDCLLNDLAEKYPGLLMYIRGDANVNHKNKNRVALLHSFCNSFGFQFTRIDHHTYHHFMGQGNSDSQLDILLHSQNCDEDLIKIVCNQNDPTILSHHDLIFSRFNVKKSLHQSSLQHPSAPRLQNDRVKIQWSDEGISAYLSCIGNSLSGLRERCITGASESLFSVLLSSTYDFLNKCARSTNNYVNLAQSFSARSTRKPLFLVKSERSMRTCFNSLKKTPMATRQYLHLTSKLKHLKQHHKRLIRFCRMSDAIQRDVILDNFQVGSSSSRVYAALKKLNRTSTCEIQSIKVGSDTYSNECVPDGIYQSIKQLKTEDIPYPDANMHYPDFREEYQYLLEICHSREKIPLFSYSDAEKNLRSLKKSVNDFYSITPLHFLHAGPAGIEHFLIIMNTIISNINFAGIPELNAIYAIVLYKGHGKDRNDAKSYRTISTCPLIAKALDSHVRSLSVEAWNSHQAMTQYQGDNMSHELAALLLTETINYSLFSAKKPLYVLFLDARAAFDRTIGMILIRNMFFAGTDDQRLNYINNRLHNRHTFCEFNHQLMGPILDRRGLEQGGIYSSDAYKIYNNEQTISSHQSSLGAFVYDDCISCISLADDVALVSDSLVDLNNLLYLTKEYGKKYDVELVPEKTNLLMFRSSSLEAEPNEETSFLELNGNPIPFTSEAEHLGVVRTSSASNLPNVMKRISAHRRKLYSLLPSGVALRHNASPSSCLKVEKLYALPVLLSGLGSLVLSAVEVKTLHSHYKNTLRSLLKLPKDVPDPALFFLAGSFPVEAYLHMRVLSNFSMICHLQDNPLRSIAKNALIRARPSSRSWFTMLRKLCIKYNLPHPLTLLDSPLPPSKFKSLYKQQIKEYWRVYLSEKCSALSSLQYLRAPYLSLTQPHPIFASLQGNPYELRAASLQALLLCGRYRTEKLLRHWSSNKEGFCLNSECLNLKLVESREHFLLHCGSFSEERRRLYRIISDFSADKPVLKNLLNKYFYTDDDTVKMQFILDPSVLPQVISAVQVFGGIIHQYCLKVSRLWCRSLHAARMKKFDYAV